MDRSFTLPAMSAIALCVTGCSSGGIIGEWTATSYDYDGTLYQLPETYSYTQDDIVYTTTFGFKLIVEDDRAAVGSYYEYSSSDGGQETDEYFYSGTWEKGEKGSFDFDFDDEGGLNMNCVLEKDELTCTTGDDARIDFVKASSAE